jgi:hypothetical protein
MFVFVYIIFVYCGECFVWFYVCVPVFLCVFDHELFVER